MFVCMILYEREEREREQSILLMLPFILPFLRCKKCCEKFWEKNTLKDHEQEHHSEEKTNNKNFYCKQCDRAFRKETTYEVILLLRDLALVRLLIIFE